MKTKSNLFAMILGVLLLALPDVVNAQFTFTTNNGVITITGYTGSGGAVVIPDTTNGLRVAAIGSGAFQFINTVTSVTIPGSVTNISDYSFYHCQSLTVAYFKGNAPMVGREVFGFNPATVYYLAGTSGWSSIYGDRPAVMLNPPDPAGSLKVTIYPAEAITNGAQWQVDGGVLQPSGATVSGLSVGSHTVGCTSLNGWVSPLTHNVTVAGNATTTDIGIYDQLTYITNNGAIIVTKCSNGGVVVLPSTISGLPVTSIGSYAFQNISSLVKVTVPGSVTNIGDYAFQGCGSLTGLYFQGNAPLFGANVFGSATVTNYYLAGTSGWSSMYQGRPTVMLNPPSPAGSLKVTFSPAAATNAGAQWQVDGGVAQPGGATVLGLSVGDHTVSFNPLNGWAIPPGQTLAVSADTTAAASGAYCQLLYATNNGAITIIGHTNTGSGAVILSSTISGMAVTSIGSYAFQNATTLTTITIPSSVTNIGYAAFVNCYGLTGVYFQGNAPSLDKYNPYAFNTSVTVYYLPGTSGWSSMYQGRPTVMLNPPSPAGSLKVTFSPAAATNAGAQWQVDGGVAQPGGATVLGLSVGDHTVSFNPLNGWAIPPGQTLAVSADTTAAASGAYCQLLYATNNGAITITGHANAGSGDVVLPSTINGLPVTSIGSYAFQNCASLTNITIPGSITNIGYEAFANCYDLTGVYFQGNAPSLDKFASYVFNTAKVIVYYLPGTSGWGSMYGGRPAVMLTSLDPTGSIRVVIASFAAAINGAQWQVDGGAAQPSGTTVSNLSVGDHTVSFTPLNGWIIPPSQTVAVSAYATTNVVSGTYSQLAYTINNGTITITGPGLAGVGPVVVLPGTISGLPVTGIGNHAFFGRTGVNSITIPDSVTNIGSQVFTWCSDLEAITVDPANSFYSSTNGVLFNKDQTTLIQFSDGAGGSYTIPKSVNSIGDYAFAFCIPLTAVTIPNSVTNIGDYAFEYCPNLTSLYFLGNAPSLNSSVFYDDNDPKLFGGYEVYDDLNPTAYCLPSTTGWATFDANSGLNPAVLWLPQAQTGEGSFGVQTNQFGFNIVWANDLVVVVEACTDLANPVWTPVGTNTLTGGSSYFSDSEWTNYPGRFYRLRSQ